MKKKTVKAWLVSTAYKEISHICLTEKAAKSWATSKETITPCTISY